MIGDPFLQNNIILNTFNAGKKWFYKFMRRNPRLSLRLPEATLLVRMRGFSKGAYFTLLEGLVDKYNRTGLTIYNVDESGFTTVQKKPQKILVSKENIK